MTANYSILFYLKKPKAWDRGSIPIYLRITVAGVQKEMSIGRSCLPERWCSRTCREKGNKESTKLLNAYIDELEKKVQEAHTTLIKQRREITAVALRNTVQGKEEPNGTPKLIKLFEQHNTAMDSLIGVEYRPNTLKGYRTTVKHLQTFLLTKFEKTDIFVTELDYSFIVDFDYYLKTNGCSPVSAAKYLKNLKKITNNCINRRLLTENPFLGYKNKARAKEREFLTQAQLDRIVRKKIGIPRIAQVRDIFVFCCYTGLSYADVKKLNRDEIMTGVDGGQWIFTEREKTTTSACIPLVKPAIDIIEKYSKYPLCEDSGMVLPVLSNQKMNSYLKEIADLCDIPQNLTFHLARHTFATTVTLSNGVPIESVSRMLGHTDLRTTQHYAKVLDIKVSNDMDVLKKKYANV